MSIEDKVRAIVAPLAWPETGHSIEDQISAVTDALDGPRESNAIAFDYLVAALETLRWVQSRKEAK